MPDSTSIEPEGPGQKELKQAKANASTRELAERLAEYLESASTWPWHVPFVRELAAQAAALSKEDHSGGGAGFTKQQQVGLLGKEVRAECEEALELLGGWYEEQDLGGIVEAVLTRALEVNPAAEEDLQTVDRVARQMFSLPSGNTPSASQRDEARLAIARSAPTQPQSLSREDGERLERIANIIGAVHKAGADPELHEDDARFLRDLKQRLGDGDGPTRIELVKALEILALDTCQGSTLLPDELTSNRYETEGLLRSGTIRDEPYCEMTAEGEQFITDVLAHEHEASPAKSLGDGGQGEAAEGLPPELAKALLDPTVIIARDRESRLADGRTLADHLEEWRNAPSNTVSAAPLPPQPVPSCLSEEGRQSLGELLKEEGVLDEAEDAYKSSPVGGRRALEAAFDAALEAINVR